MEAVYLQSFACTTCGWQFGALSQPICPRCQKAMQVIPGTRRRKICGHEDHAQCTIRCFAAVEESEGGRKRAAA